MERGETSERGEAGSEVASVEMTSLVPATTWPQDAADVPLDYQAEDERLARLLHDEELRAARDRPTKPDSLSPDEQLAMQLYEQELRQLEASLSPDGLYELQGVPLFRPDQASINGAPLSAPRSSSAAPSSSSSASPPVSSRTSRASGPDSAASASRPLRHPSTPASAGASASTPLPSASSSAPAPRSSAAAFSARLGKRPSDRNVGGAALAAQLKQVRAEKLGWDRERAARSLRSLRAERPPADAPRAAEPVASRSTSASAASSAPAAASSRRAPSESAAPAWRNTRFGRQRVWTLDDIDRLRRDELDANAAYRPGAGEEATRRSGGAFQTLSNLWNDPERVGKEALRYTNEFRARHGLGALEWHPTLCEIGAKHSKDMGDFRLPFSHEGFEGRVRQFPMYHSMAAENLALNAGCSDPARTAVDGWIASPGHCKNLLHAGMRWCGIGVYRNSHGTTYLTQLFAG